MSDWLLYREDAGIVGPLSSRLVLDGIDDGRVPPDTKVRAIADTAWRPLGHIPIFALAVRSARPPDPVFRRPPFDGLQEAAANEEGQSLRPHAFEERTPPDPPARRPPARTFGGGIAWGLALGLVVVAFAAWQRVSPPGSRHVAQLSVRAAAASVAQRVAAASAPAMEYPAAVATAPIAEPPVAAEAPAPKTPNKGKAKRPSPRRPSALDQPGF